MLYRATALFLLMMSSMIQAQPNNGNAETTQQSEGEVRYISDDLYTFLHAGPGRNFRILGSVTAGTQIRELQTDDESGYVEIIDDKDRRGWVDGNFVVERESIRNQLSSLQSSLTSANESVDEQSQTLEQLNQQLLNLQSENSALKTENTQMQQQQATLQQQLTAQDNSELQQWFIRGGGIAIVGVILGVIIAYLPKKTSP